MSALQHSFRFLRYARNFFPNSSIFKRCLSVDFRETFKFKLYCHVRGENCVVPHFPENLNTSQYKTANISNNPSLAASNTFDILSALDIVLILETPSRIIKSKFYRTAMKKIKENIIYERHNKDTLIKALFYIALQKKNVEAQKLIGSIILYLEDCLSDLTLMDTCIVADATFKTSTRITKSNIVHHFNKTLEDNLQKATNDIAILVCLLKVLRRLQFFNYDLLRTLAAKLDLEKISFTSKAHIIAYFAEARYSCRADIEKLMMSGLEDLRDKDSWKKKSSRNFIVAPRAKDVARFLWATSMLGIKLEDKVVEDILLPLFHAKEKTGKFDRQPHLLVDSLLSLCIMGHYCKTLQAWALSRKSIQLMREQGRIHPWSQLRLLETSSRIENGDTFCLLPPGVPDIPKPSLESHLAQRLALKQVYSAVACLAPSLGLFMVDCQYQVPYLHIAGIVAQETQVNDRNYIHIEFLEPSVCLHQSEIPTGLMQMKIRLLRKLGHKVMLLRKSQMPDNPSAMFTWIEDEIRKELNT